MFANQQSWFMFGLRFLRNPCGKIFCLKLSRAEATLKEVQRLTLSLLARTCFVSGDLDNKRKKRLQWFRLHKEQAAEYK